MSCVVKIGNITHDNCKFVEIYVQQHTTTVHKKKFMIPIEIAIHTFYNLAASEMIYKDHHIQITYNLFLPTLLRSLVYDMQFL